jgi:hypothetical protein
MPRFKSVIFGVLGALIMTASVRADWTLFIESPPEPPSPQEAAADAALKVVDTARYQLHRTSVQLSRQFEQSTEYQAARAAALQAFMNYQMGKQGSLAMLRISPTATAAQIEIDRLEKQLDDARQKAKLAGTDHSAAISAIALELLEKRSAVSHLESLAMAADQNLSTLRYAWIDANAKLAQMQDDFAQRLRSDPQWQSAKIQLEQARTSLASISQ